MRNVRTFHIAIVNNPDPRNETHWHQGPISNRLSRARRLARKLGQNAMLFQETAHYNGGRTWSNLKRISLYPKKSELIPNLVGHGGRVKVGEPFKPTDSTNSKLVTSALNKIA